MNAQAQDPEVTSLQSQATTFQAEVAAMQITDPESYRMAGELIVEIAGYMKRVRFVLDPIVRAADDAHKIAVRQRDGLLKPAQEARDVLGMRMGAWDREQKRIRDAAAEAARLERERQERVAREQAAAEQKRLQAEADERQLNAAAVLEANGDHVGAARLISEPAPVPIVVPAPVFAPVPMPALAQKIEGVSFRDQWGFEVVDPAQLPREYLIPDDKAIGAVVRALKDKTRIPGVRVFPKAVTSVKA